MNICLTGHRPDKLYGYNLNNKNWDILKEKLKDILRQYNPENAISGMALGCDTIFALAILELKEEGYPINLICAVPFKGQENAWSDIDKRRYKIILEQADFVEIVSDKPYSAYLLQKRNEYMVDNSDLVIAVWDGSSGGTKNCVDYAKKKNKDILYINPEDL